MKINAVRVGRFTGLSIGTDWGGKGLPFCLLSFPLLLRWADVCPGIVAGTQGFEDCVCCACMLRRWSLLYSVFPLTYKCPILLLHDQGIEKVSQHFPGQLGAALRLTPLQQETAQLCMMFFFSMTSSMYMVSEEDPNSISHILLGLPFIWVATLVSPTQFRFLRALSISSCVISTVIQSGRSFHSFSGEKSHSCIVLEVASHSGRRLELSPSSSMVTTVPTSAVGVSQAIPNFFHDEAPSFVMPRKYALTFFTSLCVQLPIICPIESESLHRGQSVSLAMPNPPYALFCVCGQISSSKGHRTSP
jgi:hypothetical protein